MQNILHNQQLVCSQTHFILKENVKCQRGEWSYWLASEKIRVGDQPLLLHLSHIRDIDSEAISRKRQSLGTSGSLGRRMRMKDEHLLAPTTC